MGDDWQDAAFSSRHMHNNRGNKSKRSTFDVRKTFGSYEVKCSAWQKLDNISSDRPASLELYRLTEKGEGVVGQLQMPGAIDVAVVLAASRESLRRTVETVEGEEDEDEDEEEDNEEQSRFETLTAKPPSSPKLSRKASEGDDVETGLGYIVFAGNDCRKFKGTLNCEAYGWKDVAITGHKIAARSESDVPVVWGRGRIAM
jgi:hypothetical protein